MPFILPGYLFNAAESITAFKLNKLVTDATLDPAFVFPPGVINIGSLSMNTGRILGRTTPGLGPAEEIAIGTGLSLAAGVLSATALPPPVSVGSITGTANQVFANGTFGVPQTGPVVLTLPQDIAPTSNVQFGRLLVSNAGASRIFHVLGTGGYALATIESGGVNQNTYLEFKPSGTGQAVFQVNSTDRMFLTATGINNTRIGVDVPQDGHFTNLFATSASFGALAIDRYFNDGNDIRNFGLLHRATENYAAGIILSGSNQTGFDTGATDNTGAMIKLWASPGGYPYYGNVELIANSQNSNDAYNAIFFKRRTGVNTIGDSMMISGTGNVGIGTTAPAFKLEVAGRISASGAEGFSSSTYIVNARNPIWRFGNADGYGLSYFQGTAGISGGNDSIGFHFGTATAAASTVNITPTSLVVRTNTNGISRNLILANAANTGDNGPGIFFTNADQAFDAGSISVVRDAATLSQDMRFATTPNWTTTAPTPSLTIQGAGNVGIGTTSPGVKLDIIGQVARLSGDSGNATEFRIINTTPGGRQWIMVSWGNNAGGGALTGKFSIFDGAVGARLTIDAAGKVGIGTTSPQNQLHVEGTIQIGAGSALWFPHPNTGDTNDGRIGAGLFAPGLNIVGIKTDGTFRKFHLWGEINQVQNDGQNYWNGRNIFAGPLRFEALPGGALVTDGSGNVNVSPLGGTLPVGTILVSAAAVIPGGFLACDGAAVSRATYAALFAAIGATYGGGDGSTTFNVPDFRGRSPIGEGTGTANGATNWPMGRMGGEEVHQLSVGEMPSHTHGYETRASLTGIGGANPLWANVVGANTAATGGDESHNTLHPVTAIRFIIKT
jgi:microcystin-dependent protein